LIDMTDITLEYLYTVVVQNCEIWIHIL